MALSVSQKIILHEEDTYGAVKTGSTGDHFALPIETANLNLIIEPFNDQTKRGTASLDSEVYSTVKRIEGNIEGPFFTDEVSYFLLALLGKDTVSTGTVNTHQFVAKTDFSSVPSSLTIDMLDDARNFEFKGCYVSSFTMRFSAAEGILTYTASIIGQDFTDGSATLTDADFAEPVPVFGWTGTLNTLTASRTADNELVGSSVETGLIDAEITFNRPTALTYTLQEQQICHRADPGPLEVTARFTYDWDSTASPVPGDLVGRYTADGSNRKGYRFDLTNNETGSSKRIVRIYLPSATLLDAPLEIDRSDTAMKLNAGIRAVGNTHADLTGPVRVTTTSRRTTLYDGQ